MVSPYFWQSDHTSKEGDNQIIDSNVSPCLFLGTLPPAGMKIVTKPTKIADTDWFVLSPFTTDLWMAIIGTGKFRRKGSWKKHHHHYYSTTTISYAVALVGPLLVLKLTLKHIHPIFHACPPI